MHPPRASNTTARGAVEVFLRAGAGICHVAHPCGSGCCLWERRKSRSSRGSTMLAIGKGGYSALRRGRVSIPGQPYLLTTATDRRRDLFDDFERATAFCRELHGRQVFADHDLLCWVLMPDHWHGLLVLGEHESLARCMQRFKSVSALALRRLDAGIGNVWARGYHERAVRSSESLIESARYVIANPVRAGLAARAGSYPFWDAAWLGS
jgi:putative transposase